MAHLLFRTRLIVGTYDALGELHKDIVEHHLAHFLICRNLQLHNEAQPKCFFFGYELMVGDELRSIIVFFIGHVENHSF